MFKINIPKKRLETVGTNLKFDASILSMRKLKLKDAFLLITGLSNGDIVIISIQFDSNNLLTLQLIGTLEKAHDFGVNSLHALTC